jgi:hypothetical protein
MISFVVRFLSAIIAFTMGAPAAEVIVPERVEPGDCPAQGRTATKQNRKIVKFPTQT